MQLWRSLGRADLSKIEQEAQSLPPPRAVSSDRGQVGRSGGLNHDELIALNGSYAALYRFQFAGREHGKEMVGARP